jgi:hypothetical protein
MGMSKSLDCFSQNWNDCGLSDFELLLTPWAIKRRALSLYDALNSAEFADRTSFARFLVHAMLILIRTILIQSVAIRAIVQR